MISNYVNCLVLNAVIQLNYFGILSFADFGITSDITVDLMTLLSLSKKTKHSAFL